MRRNTRQREAILASLHASGRSLSPLEILEDASRDVPNLSLATVYRQLRGLLAEANVNAVELPGESPRYETPCTEAMNMRDHHHHHFHCEACDRVFPIHGCPGSMKHLVPRGFRVERHDLTLHGRCVDCAPRR